MTKSARPSAPPASGKAKANRGTDAKRDGKPGETAAWPAERGGPKDPEPTRYGDWEKGGRCTDF